MTTSLSRYSGLIYILLAASGYALLPIFTKNIYAASTFEPLDIAIWRFIFATPIIWTVIASRQRKSRPELPPRRQLIGLGFVYSLAAFSAFFGLERIPASLFVVLFYTYPAFVVILSALMGQRISTIAWLALALTLVGVALTIPDLQNIGSSDLIGIGAAIVNALAVAIYYLLSGKVMRGYSAIARSTGWVIGGALLVLLCMIPVRGLAIPDNTDSLINLILLAAIATAMPIFTLNTGIQKLGAAQASIISSIEPVFAMMLAVVLLGEIILPIQWLGSIFIISSVILLQLRPGKRKIQMTPAGNKGL